MKFLLAECDLITWEQPVPMLQNANGGDIYFYPGFAVIRAARSAFSLLDARDITVTFNRVGFVETDPVPSDSQVQGHTWAKANKDGSPDLRFTINYKLPIATYGQLVFTSSTGLREEYMCSNAELAEQFWRSWKLFQKSLGGASHQGSE